MTNASFAETPSFSTATRADRRALLAEIMAAKAALKELPKNQWAYVEVKSWRGRTYYASRPHNPEVHEKRREIVLYIRGLLHFWREAVNE
jgi:hypothetical protein